jgi:curved DNA-binding protein
MANRNYYAVLEVNKNASVEEIKQAYRSLARKYHPDRNPGDKSAEEKFKDINEAYSILSDEGARSQYDQQQGGRKKAVGVKASPFAGFGNFSGQNRNGNTATQERPRTRINAAEAYNNRRVKRERVVSTPPPKSTPRRDIEAKLTLPLDKAYRGGRQRIRLEDGRSLEVDLPPGIVDGKRIRLKGQGLGGGDLYLKITLARHPFFELQGIDIYCQVPVSPVEAVLGGAIEVPTIDGLVQMTIPHGVRSGQRLRLANKGYPNRSDRQNNSAENRGDQLVEIQIVAPKDISEAQKELYQQIKNLEQNNPRQHLIDWVDDNYKNL